MKQLLVVVAGLHIIVCAVGPAEAQQSSEANDGAFQSARFETTALTSPSSATSTVSPSTVPQTFSRLDDSQTDLALSLGTSYASGKFGTGSTTTISTSALGARLRVSNWTISASLPWMRIRSRSTVFTGIDATPVLVAPNSTSRSIVSDGLGDVTLGGSYSIAPKAAPFEIELSGRAKINTATKSSGLSSGKNDYSVGGDISVPLGRVTPFASLSYRFLGNTAQYNLRDGPAGSAGASYALGHQSYLLASYHYSSAATHLVNDAHELFGGASIRIARSPLRLTAYATAGLSDGAPAASGGLALSIDVSKATARR